MSNEELRQFRGQDAAMIFQDPMTALNPVTRVGSQIEEIIHAHQSISRKKAKERTADALKDVKLPGCERRFPHELSGGMRQRIMIAIALANKPYLLIADEPTTALDVTIQATVLDLIRDLSVDAGTAVLFVSHDMDVIASVCTRVLVMYAGRIVESGPTSTVLRNPQHPYTWSLLQAVPRPVRGQRPTLAAIEGSPPNMADLPAGCKFHPRCRFSIPRCMEAEPDLESVGDKHFARCWVTMDKVGNREGGRLT